MDLTEELERAIPSGPPLPPVAERLAAGHAALRRRRLTVAVAAAGAVAAVAVPIAVVLGSPVSRATDPTPPPILGSPPVPGATVAPDPASTYPWKPGEVAAVDLMGGTGLMIRPGAVVLERRDDLFPAKDTESVALRVRFRGLEYWAMWEWDEGGAVGSPGSPRDPFYTDFENFIDISTSDGGLTHGSTGPSRGQDDGTFEPVTLPWLSVTGQTFVAEAPGRILEQRTDLDFPENFAPAGTPTAAALVEADGVRYLALFRGADSDLLVVDATGQGDTLGALLDWARARYASEVGLL